MRRRFRRSAASISRADGVCRQRGAAARGGHGTSAAGIADPAGRRRHRAAHRLRDVPTCCSHVPPRGARDGCARRARRDPTPCRVSAAHRKYLLALLGGAAGTLLAVWSVDLLMQWIPSGVLPRMEEVSVDVPVLSFSLVLSLATGLLFGLAAAVHGSSTTLMEILRDGPHTGSGGSPNSRSRCAHCGRSLRWR